LAAAIDAEPILDHEILLSSNDTFELLRILEEVTSNSTFAPTEYLYQLVLYLQRQSNLSPRTNGDITARTNGTHPHDTDPTARKPDTSKKGIEETMKRGLGDAQRKLDEVRLAIARNLSRALVQGFDNPF
jgi:nuclear pore complex protein Nup85